MLIFEIDVSGKQQTRAGASDQTSNSLRLNGGEGFDSPQLSVSAFKVAGEKLEKHYRWNFPALEVGDRITIRVSEEGLPDKPTVVDTAPSSITKDEKALMTHEVRKLRSLTRKLVAQAVEEDAHQGDTRELYCSFCGKSRTEVDQLIAGPSASICNDCVSACVEIAKSKS